MISQILTFSIVYVIMYLVHFRENIMKSVDSDLGWIKQIDPKMIQDVLLRVMKAKPRDAQLIVDRWNDTGWYLWTFESYLGSAFNFCRDVSQVALREPDAPTLSVQCYASSPGYNENIENWGAAMKVANKELLKILIDSDLRK